MKWNQFNRWLGISILSHTCTYSIQDAYIRQGLQSRCDRHHGLKGMGQLPYMVEVSKPQMAKCFQPLVVLNICSPQEGTLTFSDSMMDLIIYCFLTYNQCMRTTRDGATPSQANLITFPYPKSISNCYLYHHYLLGSCTRYIGTKTVSTSSVHICFSSSHT